MRYTSSSRQFTFRPGRPISDEEIRVWAPSVMAAEPHQSRGERYSFIPTIDVLHGLQSAGFHPYEVRQTKTRDAGKRAYTKHLVRLRHNDYGDMKGVIPELILLNSHDGTSAYRLMAGFFRMVCSNGLISGTMQNDIKFRHSGNIVDDVIEGSFTVLNDVQNAVSDIERFKSIELSRGDKLAFAEAAKVLKWDLEDAPVSASQLLGVRRWEDAKDDLWSVFNRVQENMIVGGLRGRSVNGRMSRTRNVTSIHEDVRLNRSLWTLAQSMAGVKVSQVEEAA